MSVKIIIEKLVYDKGKQFLWGNISENGHHERCEIMKSHNLLYNVDWAIRSYQIQRHPMLQLEIAHVQIFHGF